MRISDWSSDVCSSDLSAECLDTHYFAVLIGVGATTVNAYLAQEAIADRHARGLFGDFSLDQCVTRFRKAVDDGLLKIMSKMGIAVISSYRGGYNFEAVGLSRALRSEERRVGQECVSTVNSSWSRYHYKQKN